MDLSPEIKELRKAVDVKFGKTPVTPTDFTLLSKAIEHSTGIPISVSTLKRMWGYVKGYGNTRKFTYDLLSRYAGVESWESFLQKLNDDGSQSNFYGAEILRSNSLTVGDCVEVTWQPNRHCKFRYLGDNRFVVERSENAKIDVGDQFECEMFRAGQPLYLDDVCHKGSLAAYVAGASDGVSFRVVPLQ